MLLKIIPFSIQYIRLVLLCNYLLLSFSVCCQQKFHGVVTGIDNSPLQGASIVVKQTNAGTITDNDGSFEIEAKPNDIIIVSFVGYATQQIKTGNETFLKILLLPSAVNLDEVIVTGYTVQKVKEITGSIAVVKPKELKEIPGGQVEQMLQGRVAGLNVVSSGQPGGGSNMRLHGIGNFGDVTPLYIIDGVEGNINNLNANDIESLQVLKDASAYSIYGVRGANGVIVITTKKGKVGKAVISYDFYLGDQIPLRKGFQYLSPIEEAELVWLHDINSGNVDANGNPSERLYGTGPVPVLPDYIIHDSGYMANAPQTNSNLYNIDYTKGPIYQIVKANKEGTDWFHKLFTPALNQNHTITVSGGNEGNRYLFSLGYTNQQGTLLNTYLKRYTARVNTEFTVKKAIHIGENMQLTYRDNLVAITQSFNAFQFNPVLTLTDPGLASSLLPVYDIKGNWATFGDEARGAGFELNPVAARVLTKSNINNNWEIFGNLYAEADILRYFTARTSFGGSVNNYYSRYYYYGSFQPPNPEFGPNNSVTENGAYQNSWTWTNTLSFSKSFAEHSVKAFIASEAISNYGRQESVQRDGFLVDDPNYTIISNGTYSQISSGFAEQSTLFSLLGQVNYNFKQKYFLTATLRRDGSSVFGIDNRYGWFPSVGIAWQLMQENFLQNCKWIDELKLRASKGVTGYYGNVDPGNQYSLYSVRTGRSFYDISGTNTRPALGIYRSRIGNPETSWQQDIVTNVGLDASLWSGKLSITANWYNKQSSGLLFPTSALNVAYAGDVDPSIGNVGSVSNKGIDLLIGTKGNFSRDLKWDVTLTFDTYENKITHLNNLNYFDNGFTRNEVGFPIGLYFGYKVIGLFQNQNDVNKSPVQESAAPGKLKYLDANGDGLINDDDRVFIGNPNSKFASGINIGFTYKNFDFSTFLYGSFGNDLYNLVNAHGGLRAELYNSWRPGKSNTLIPISEGNAYNDFSEFLNLFNNSYFVEKGAYLRNKAMMIGFNLPQQTIKRFHISHLRIYAEALNIFTLTRYSGLDPEITGENATGNENVQATGIILKTPVTNPSANFGIDVGAYPNGQKQYLIGLNVSF